MEKDQSRLKAKYKLLEGNLSFNGLPNFAYGGDESLQVSSIC